MRRRLLAQVRGVQCVVGFRICCENGVPVAVLVVGNRNSGSSYPYGTAVTLDNVTFTAPEDVLGIYVYQNKPEEAVSVKGTVTALPSVNTDSMNDATYEVAVK